jgi:hypothetical protein
MVALRGAAFNARNAKMIDKRNMLLMELESLQSRRRGVVDAYVSTGNRACWSEVREVSQAIAEKLDELEKMRCPDALTKAIDGLMEAEL